MAQIASRFKWVFGTDPYANDSPTLGGRNSGPSNNVLGSSGAGVAFNTHGWGTEFTFLVESNDSGAAWQIRSARTSSGPWGILSSGSAAGGSTTVLVTTQVTGPLGWLSPRVDALLSTANYVIVRMTAIEP